LPNGGRNALVPYEMHRPVFGCLVVALAASFQACAAGEDGVTRQSSARVVAVVDGDTVRVRVRSGTEPVRLIGIDTPETHRRGTPVQCGGAQATARLRRLLHPGQAIVVVGDPTQDARDRYGRRLAYVQLRSGRDVGATQVAAGWARVYVYDQPFRRLGRYRAASARARAAGRGVYRSCDGRFNAAV
jgi:micrococcal nuclease